MRDRKNIIHRIAKLKVEILIFLTVCLTHGHFYTGQSWHQNSHLNNIFSSVEPRTEDAPIFSIDRFMVDPLKGLNTGDWAKVDGHYYSNKAPGAQIISIPFYWMVYLAESALGVPIDDFFISHFNAYLINLWISVIFSALAASLFYRFIRCMTGASERTGIAITLACFYSTLIFPYNSQVWGHTTAAAFVTMGGHFLYRKSHIRAGLLFGLAMLTDYLAIVPLFCAFAYFLIHKEARRGPGRFILGATPPILFLLVYQKIIFGSYLTPASASIGNPWFDKALFGEIFSGVRLDIVCKLLFSEARGILLHMPILIFGIYGGHKLYIAGKGKLVGLCFTGIIASLFLISSFNGWHGGATTGSRYLIVSLPLWFALLSGMAYAGPRIKRIFYTVAILNAFQMLVILTTTTIMARDHAGPLRYLYNCFFNGVMFFRGPTVKFYSEIAVENEKWLNFDWGVFFGLQGAERLIPFVFISLLCAIALRFASSSKTSD